MITKLILIALIVFAFTNTNLYSKLEGQAYLDSLLKEVVFMKEDTSGVILLLKIGIHYHSSNPKEGLNYSFRALKLAKKNILAKRHSRKL